MKKVWIWLNVGTVGVNVPPENKSCANCGKPVNRASSATQVAYTTPQAPASYPLTPSSRLGAAFWLGLIGAVFGLLFGLWIVAVAGTYNDASLIRYAPGIGLIIFSVLGIVGAIRIFEGRDTINAGLMILAGVGVLVSNFLAGIFSALLFFVGAALIYLKKG